MLSRNFQLVTEAVRSVFHVVSVSSKVSVEELALSALALQKIMAGQNQENDFQSLAKKVLDYACGRNYFREHDLEYLKKFYHSEAKVVDQNFLRSLVGALLKLEKFKVAKKRYETARLISQKITVEQRELLDLFIVHERDVEEYGAYLKTLVLYGESGTEDATLHSSKNADKVRMQELRDPRMSLLKIARYCSERYLDSSSGESWVTNCFFKVLEIERVWVDAFLLHVEYFSRWVSECGVSVIVSRACEDGTPTAEQFYGDGKTLSVFILLLTKFVNLLGTSSQKTFILSVVERSLRRQLSHFSTGKYTVDEKTMFLSTIWINFATRTFSHLIEALEVLGKTGTAYTLLFHYFDNLSNVDSPFIIHQDMISFEIEWLHVMNIFAYRKSSLVEVSQALSPLGEQRRFSIIVNNVVRQYKELLAVFCQDVHYSSEIVKELISEFTSFIGICYMTNEGCLFQVTRSQGVESPLAEMYQSTLQAWKDSAANSQFFTNLLNILDCFMVNMARFLRQVFQSSIWSVGDAYLTATAAMISAFLAALNQMSYLDDENVKWIVLRHKRTVLEFHKLMSGREILILFSKKKLAEEIFYGSFTCELTEQTEFLESFRSFLCEYVANESDEYSHTILSSMLQIIMSAKIIIEDDSVNFERSSNCFVASVDFLDEILDSYISSLTVCPSSVHLKLVENEGIYLLSNGILRLEEEKAALANEDHCKKCSSLNRKLQVILKIFFSNETAPLISLYSDRVWRIFIMFLENEDTSDLGKDLLRRIFLGADEQENLLDLPKDFTLSETRKHCRLFFQGLLDRLEFHCFQDSVGAERKALLLRKYLSLFSSLVAESMRIMQRMFRNSRGFEIFKAIFSDSDSDFVRSIAIDLLKLLAQVTRNNPKAEFELKSLFPCNFLVHTLNSCYPEGVSSEVIAALLEVVVGSPILIRHNSDNFQWTVWRNLLLPSDLCDLSFSESTRDLDNLLNLSVLFLYAPRCCGDSRTCPDGSLAAVGSRKSIAARLIGSSGESRVCSVNNIIDSLHCVGGLRSVLELFFALDNFSSSTLGTDETEADSVSADVLESLNELTCYFLKIIAEILRYDKQAEIEWMNTHVFDYLGAWFFETKLSFSSKEVIDAIFQLFETCSDRKSVVSVCTKRCLSNEFLWSKMTQDVAVHFWKALCSLKDNSTLSPNVLLDVIGNFDVDSAVFVSRESRDISLCKGIIDFILLGFKMLFTNSDFVTSGNQFLVIDGATQRDGVSYLEQIEHAYSRALVENLLKPVCFHALDEMNQDAFAKLNYLLQALSSLSNFLSVSVRASCFSFLIHQDLIEVLLKVLKSTSQLRLVLFSIAALFDLFESNSDECVQWVTSQFRLSELSASMEKEEWKNHVIGGLCMFITGTLQGADADLTMLLEHLMSSDFLGGPCSTQGTIEKIRTGALPLIIMLLTKENNLIGKASMIQALVALLEESRQLTETFLCFNLWSFWIISLSRVNTFSTCDEDELFSSYVSSFKKLVVHLFKHFIEDWGMSVTTFYQVEELVFAAWNLIDATFAMQVLTWFLQCVKDIAVPLLLSQGIFGMNIGAKCSQTLESTNIEGFAMVFLFTKLICDMGNMQNAEAKQKDTRLKLEMCELCIEIILLLGLLSTSSASYSGESKVVGNDFEFLGIHVFPRSAVLDLFGKYENERRYPASRPGQNSFKLDEQTFIEPLCKGGFVRISLLFIIDALVEKLKLQEEFSYYETLLSSIGEVHGGLRVDKIWRHYVEQHFTNLISESTPNPSEISQKNELELLLGNLVKRWKQSKHSVEHKSTGFFRPFKNKSLGRNMQVLTSPTAGSEMIASLMKSEQEWNETGYACMFSAVMEWKKRVDQSFDILENISTVLSSNTHIQKDVLREVNVSEGVRNDAKSRLKASEFRKLVFGFRKHLSYQELMKDSTKTQWSLAGIMDSLQRRWLLKPTENIDTQWKRLSQSAQQMSSLSNYSEEGVTSPSRDSVTDANQKRNSDVTTITGPHLSLPVDNLSIQQFDESYQKNWSIESPEPSSASPSSSTPLLSSMELLAARTAASASDVQWSGSCIWVRFLKAVPGRLELRERSIRFLQSPFNEESERVLSPGYFVKTSSTEEDIENIQELTFPLEEIQHLEFRRFLLQHKAFEIFLQNKKSYFFALQTSRACKTCLKLLSKLLELPHNRLLPSHNTSGPRSVYAGGAFKFPRCLLDWKTVQALTADACARWKRRQLSNFEYLCILNRLAGRSNNDLCQYPIFPWILADYSTEKLDLTDPKTFRDLAKPVGCQPSTSSEEAGERERRFRERFETWADKAIPPFHYGSHYSSAAAALHYLVRVEPFTTLSLELQGGLFDHPDRMFYSLEGAWNSVTQSMQDVKELIPEFFYFPEIFRNRNGVSFGRTQDGHLIDDVLLPKWANGSPEHFVRVHREALESEYVSLNLHHWIDLIFGFRQRGPAAVEACNVFFYLTYEGAIDLESIQDMELRESMETHIAHFGQTPPQLMEDSGHPQRDHSGALLQPSYWTPQGLMAALEFSVAIGTDDSIVQICQAGDRIVSITKNQFVFRHKWIPLPDLQGSPFTFETDTKNISESAAFSSQEGNIETRRSSNREIVGGTYLASSTQASLFSLYALSFDGKVIISAGHWDWSIRCCFTSEAHKPIQCLKGHRDIVTCLSIGSDGRTLVTGSKDTTIFVWEIVWGDPERVRDPKEGKLDRSYSGGETKLGAILKVQGNVTKRRKMKVVEERPKLVLYEHEYPLVCVAVNTEVGVIASNDSCNTLMIHNLSNGHLLRILDFLKESLVDSVTVTCRNEIILVSSKKASFFLYTGNGVALKKQSICSHHDSCQILSSPTITSYTITVDGRLLFVADELNGVAVYSSWGLNLLHRYVPCPSSPVNALCLTAEESILLAGLSDGRILAYTVDRFALLQSSTLLGVEGASNPFYGC
ncbi:BEACH domain-containing protein lvsC [Galdieria sulphuraria]|nr:BEACH domain-containing protein lvsC [Galdieria sulphuraria]